MSFSQFGPRRVNKYDGISWVRTSMFSRMRRLEVDRSKLSVALMYATEYFEGSYPKYKEAKLKYAYESIEGLDAGELEQVMPLAKEASEKALSLDAKEWVGHLSRMLNALWKWKKGLAPKPLVGVRVSTRGSEEPSVSPEPVEAESLERPRSPFYLNEEGSLDTPPGYRVEEEGPSHHFQCHGAWYRSKEECDAFFEEVRRFYGAAGSSAVASRARVGGPEVLGMKGTV